MHPQIESLFDIFKMHVDLLDLRSTIVCVPCYRWFKKWRTAPVDLDLDLTASRV